MAKKKKTKTSKRVTKTAKLNKREQEEANVLLKAVSVIIAIFIAVFIALSNFSLFGSIGSIVRSVVLSTFGTLGYVFPIVIGVSVLISIFNTDKKANFKIYSLLCLYVALVCLADSLLHDFSVENDIYNSVNESIMRASKYFSFDSENFSGGAVGTSISFLTYRAFGKVGSAVVFGTISLIAFIMLFGLGLSKYLVLVFKNIFMFIPNLIIKSHERREEDRQIALDNERILKSTIEKSKKANLQVAYDRGTSSNRLVLEPIDDLRRKKYDTSNISITANDIQSRFYNGEDTRENDNTKSQLLREMKKKSINEILFEQNEKGTPNTSFFYTAGMKPINELEHINIEDNSDVFKNSYINVPDKEIVDDRQNEDKEDKVNIKEPRKTYYPMKKEIPDTTDEPIKVLRAKRKTKRYKFPPLNMLNKTDRHVNNTDPQLNEKARVLVETLKTFGVGVTVTNIMVGPSVTRFELRPDVGVKISKILSLEDDVKLALAASEIRIEAPIPGKSAIGIEVGNKKSSGVLLGDIVSSAEFKNSNSKLTVAIGKDITGKPVVTDLRKMPHLLIAGATGSGKSVCVNSIITSLIYKSSPEDVRMILVDPKMVELQVYDGIPHLLIPVVTNAKKAAVALNWAVSEMTRRYNLIQEKRVRDIEGYNEVIEGEISKIGINDDNEADFERVAKLPYIVIIIDEFADLMMVAAKDVENSIMRIAQLARACGIYLVIATQRPTVNVISGSIKTNVPSRISFAVSSGIDSQTILDKRGAEKLLGHGDMLYFPQGIPEPIRVQGCYVSEKEILNIVNYVKDDNVSYDEVAENAIEKGATGENTNLSFDPNEKDDMFVDAGRLVIEQQNASIGMLQRRFRMGFNRAARIIDQLETEGVISKQYGKKPREVLMDYEEFENKFGG